jgi:hypothetical protein
MERPSQTRASLAIVAAIIVIGGAARFFFGQKDSHTPFQGREPEPAEPHELMSALGVDAAGIPMNRPDPAPPAGNLLEEAKAFTTLDACVEQRSRLDPLVGDSLRAIGYDTFLRDSCRILEALQKQQKAPCAEISATPLRRRCESTVAIAAAHPDDCPLEGTPAEGREPFCVAVAARDPRLCVASPTNRTTCEAVLAKSEARCTRGGSEGSDCRREVGRLRALVTGELSKEKPLPAMKVTLEVQGEGQTESPIPAVVDQSPDAARGVVLVKAHDRYVLDVGRLGRSEFAPPSMTLRSAMRVSQRGGSAVLERFELDLPNRATVIFPGNNVDGKLTFEPFSPTRGAPLGVTFEGRISTGPSTYTVKVRVDTFVRDVISDDATSKLSSPLSERDR